jgi:RecA/RadA recombinase
MIKFSTALKEIKKVDTIKTIDENLNNFLGGGFNKGRVYEIYGKNGSGKTIFSMWLTKQFSKNYKVLFISTELSVNQLIEIWEKLNVEGNPDNIIVLEFLVEKEIVKMDEGEFEDKMTSIFKRLYKEIKKVIDENTPDFIVIDSIGALLRQFSYLSELADRSFHLKKLLSLLKRSAEEKNFSVLLTNQVYSIINDKNEVAEETSLGGNILWHTVNYRLKLSLFKNRYLEIIKAPELPRRKIKMVIKGEDKIDIKFYNINNNYSKKDAE